MAVPVLNRDGKGLMSCSEKRARLLIQRKRAVVCKNKPFTIKLLDRDHEDVIVNNSSNTCYMEGNNAN